MNENIFKNIHENEKEEVFEILARGKHTKIERITSNGPKSSTGEWYDQENPEWVMLLQGKSKIIFDNNEQIILHPGDYLLINSHQKHKVEILAKDEITLWLAVHYE